MIVIENSLWLYELFGKRLIKVMKFANFSRYNVIERIQFRAWNTDKN
jgi:hypothetical protein